MNLFFALLKGLWIILPAYAANASAPFANGEKRMDFGKKLGGKGIFGAGKTWEGFFLAVLVGTVVGGLEILSWSYLNQVTLIEGFSLSRLSIEIVFSVSAGAMLGDLVASFFKRRAGLERGAKAPLLDQLDFLAGGFLATGFFLDLELATVLTVVVITPALHFLSNLIGHKLGAKEVPW